MRISDWSSDVCSSDLWSEPKKLGEDEKIGHLLGPVKNKPVQLKDGTIISPSSTEIEKGGDLVWMVHFEISKDQGRTWEVVGPINDGIQFDAIQPSELFYPCNRKQVLCRMRQRSAERGAGKEGERTCRQGWNPSHE